ncbi:MAG: hypothetical protein M0Z56_09625 [Desulfobacteraceae bacterium]|nr:hypothetical protein [Desulfobacteraceae bacterium]
MAPAFEYGSDSPIDLLYNANHVLGFLNGVLAALDVDPIDGDAAHVLFMILTGIENTIDKAIKIL